MPQFVIEREMPGAGSLSVGETKLALKEVKPLPASD